MTPCYGPRMESTHTKGHHHMRKILLTFAVLAGLLFGTAAPAQAAYLDTKIGNSTAEARDLYIHYTRTNEYGTYEDAYTLVTPGEIVYSSTGFVRVWEGYKMGWRYRGSSTIYWWYAGRDTTKWFSYSNKDIIVEYYRAL